MKVLALERDEPGVTAEQFAPHLAAEAARAGELYQAGVLCELTEARSVLQTLPLRAYPGFARLFAG